MTILCSGCGRTYGAERFPGGRTLHCACGTLVGKPLHTGVAERAGPPRFLADSMLAGLARWLRLLGYDTAWEPEIDDRELVRRAVAEGRWILTRDRRLADSWWTDNLLLLRADAPLEQLREVAARVPLSAAGLFTRCSRCNLPLYEVSPEDAAHVLPPTAAGPVRRCPQCGRFYWRGSHTARMQRTLEAVLGGSGG